MKHIPRDFIDDLISRVNIVEVIGQSVTLKKKGHNYFGCCPFHHEKTPSFSVNEKKQLFHCFGCGVSGTALSFLMDYNRLSFVEAIEELAQKQGLTIPYEQRNYGTNAPSKPHHSRRELFELMARITRFYQHQLANESFAQQYLIQRGLSEKVIKDYQLGFSPNDWHTTQNNIAKNEAERKLYDLAGMLVTNDSGKSYDRFRGRIMFPIRSRQGNVIGFGARTIQQNDNVKYLNSPETPIFHKGQQLYGLFEALEANRNPQQLLVVEGYMDVISLAQYGISYAVAALGTATTPDHFPLLFRATDKIIFCYDGDLAGKRAAWKALTTALPLLQDGKVIHFVFLPENEDPDSCIRKEGINEFEMRLNKSLPLSQFLFESLLKNIDLGSSEGKSKFIAQIIPLLQQVKAPYYLLSFKQELGNYLGISDLVHIDRLIAQKSSSFYQPIKQDNRTENAFELTTIRILLATLIQYPELANNVQVINISEQAKIYQLNDVLLFMHLFEFCQQHKIQSTAQILTAFQESDVYPLLNQLAILDVYQKEDEISQFFKKTLSILYDEILKKRRDKLLAKSRTIHLTDDEKEEIAKIILALSKKVTT